MLPSLPINQHLQDIIDSLNVQPNLVLQAEPGAGKSTAVPLALLNATWLVGKKIILLEPRRVAVKSIAHFLAAQLGEKVGERIGYQIRHERCVSEQTVLEIVTEGVLTRKIQQDPELKEVGLLIFDEFHERSIHADLALMLALEVQQAYREDLKLLVMSATINTEQIASYLDQANIIRCAGRSFEVSVEYLSDSQQRLSDKVQRALSKGLAETSGDVLVFLPGQRDIHFCIEQSQQRLSSAIDFLPLYGSLSLVEQERVLSPNTSGRRRVIFATNIAETSLTIQGISLVIDAGREKVLNFDVKSGLTRLENVAISKASATQRAGRAGRVSAGHCIRLWSESQQRNLPDYQQQEITCTDLSPLVLELAAWGITQFDEANWLTPPPRHHFDVAIELNRQLKLQDEYGKITPLGQRALMLGVAPRMASMLLQSNEPQQRYLACVLAAILSERDFLLEPVGADMVSRVLAFTDHQRIYGNKASAQIHRHRLAQVRTLAKTFAQRLQVRQQKITDNLPELQQNIAHLLLIAFPERLAKQRSANSEQYLLANGRAVNLKDTDPLVSEPWLVVADCDGKSKNGLIYLATPITKFQLLGQVSAHIERKSYYQLDEKKQKILAREQQFYLALLIDERNLSTIAPEQFQQCVADILAVEGLSFLNWTDQCQRYIERVSWAASIDPSLPILSTEVLLASLSSWLLPYIGDIPSIKALRQQNIYDLLVANLTWSQQQLLAELAPEYYTAPSGKRLLIDYRGDNAPKVSVILQEVFGELSSPALGKGAANLTFELLSPARRPIQTTSDLANFWQNSYVEVAKDMRGRYPKHRWPEQPLLEKAGRSIKTRK